jgi:hypothetical protein
MVNGSNLDKGALEMEERERERYLFYSRRRIE